MRSAFYPERVAETGAEPDGTWVLRMVEEGPWNREMLSEELHRVQERLYDFVDIAVDGQLASMHPESKGKPVVIRLDCYDTETDTAHPF